MLLSRIQITIAIKILLLILNFAANAAETLYTDKSPVRALEKTKLLNFNARQYDSFTGQFMSPDPVPDKHWYRYTNNNPITFTDPTGREAQVNLPPDTLERLRNTQYRYSEPMILTGGDVGGAQILSAGKYITQTKGAEQIAAAAVRTFTIKPIEVTPWIGETNAFYTGLAYMTDLIGRGLVIGGAVTGITAGIIKWVGDDTQASTTGGLGQIGEDEEDEKKYWEDYWKRRDPNNEVPENQRRWIEDRPRKRPSERIVPLHEWPHSQPPTPTPNPDLDGDTLDSEDSIIYDESKNDWTDSKKIAFL